MRRPLSFSHHANGGSRSLDSVFRAIRLHRAMIDVLGGGAGELWCTECGFADYSTRGRDTLRLLGTLEAAGYEAATVYQLIGDGGLYDEHGHPRNESWNASLVGDIRNRNWPPCSARDIQPRTVDRLKARWWYAVGCGRRVLRWS
jgi:hypothetical protein